MTSGAKAAANCGWRWPPAAVVVLIGVEQGILLAMVLSLLRHVRHSYRPHTAVLVADGAGEFHPIPAVPGALSGPGLVIFQFGADLFYANAGRFADDVRQLIKPTPAPVHWLVVDAGAITSVDYSAARVLRTLQDDLIRQGVVLVLVHVPSSLRSDLDRHRLTDVIGADHVFETLHEALPALRQLHVHAVSNQPAAVGQHRSIAQPLGDRDPGTIGIHRRGGLPGLLTSRFPESRAHLVTHTISADFSQCPEYF